MTRESRCEGRIIIGDFTRSRSVDKLARVWLFALLGDVPRASDLFPLIEFSDFVSVDINIPRSSLEYL